MTISKKTIRDPRISKLQQQRPKEISHILTFKNHSSLFEKWLTIVGDSFSIDKSANGFEHEF